MTSSTWELLTNPDDPRHGTDNGYVNHGCRCELCTATNTVTVAQDRERRAMVEVPEHVHGTPNGYVNYKCRCDDCREAYNADARERRARNKREDKK